MRRGLCLPAHGINAEPGGLKSSETSMFDEPDRRKPEPTSSPAIIPGLVIAPEKMRYARRVKMTPAQWYAVPINPVQRDTEAHAKRAVHLFSYSPDHAIVKMAVLPSGATFKLDGHTRAFLWETGKVKPPKELHVDIYECDDASAVRELYTHFDSRLAVETSVDQVTGAARMVGLEFSSGMLKRGRYGSALKRLHLLTFKTWSADWRSSSFIYEAVSVYAAELKLLDQVGPEHRRFQSGIVQAALATFRRRGPLALEFWSRYARDAGRKDGTKLDAVQALTDIVSGNRRIVLGGGALQDEFLNRGIAACEAFFRQQIFAVGGNGGVPRWKQDKLLEYIRAPRSEDLGGN